MYKKTAVLTLGLLISYCLISFAGEEILTLETYYPSPYGIYRELRSQRMAIGETYIRSDEICWAGEDCSALVAPAVPIDSDVDLIVEGVVAFDPNDTAALNTTIGFTDKANVAEENFKDLIALPNWLLTYKNDELGSPYGFNTPRGGGAGLEDSLYLLSEEGGSHQAFLFGDSNGLENIFGISTQTIDAGDEPWIPRLVVNQNGNVGFGLNDPQATIDTSQNVADGGDGIMDNLWYRARGIHEGSARPADAGAIWFHYGPQAAPLMVLSDYDDPPRIQFQATGDGSEAAPEYFAWIGLVGSASAAEGDGIAASGIAMMGGNVGMGIINPDSEAKLNVVGDGVGPLATGKCPAGYQWNDDDEDGFIDSGECKLTVLSVQYDGDVGIRELYPTAPLDVNGDRIRIRKSFTPIVGAACLGRVGEIVWDDNSIYICVNTETWKKADLIDH